MGDGGGRLLGGLLKGHCALDIGVTTENSNYMDRERLVSVH